MHTFTQMYGARLDFNVVTGGNQKEQESYGDFLSKDDRYERTSEFLELLKRLWDAVPVSHAGKYYRIEGSVLDNPLPERPRFFFAGASDAALAVSARHADIQLMFGETPPMARERIERLREIAARQGRSISFGIRLHCITRPTEDLAWSEAARLIEGADKDLAEAQLARLAASEAEGLRRIAGMQLGNLGDPESLKIYPNLWAGSAIFNTNTALVGSHRNVAERILEYADIGVEHFILSGYPRLEENYWIGEGVLPLLGKRSDAAALPDLRKGQL